jgi:crotonobetainyl-CoA:carnitine CoA-transferase CaiB-like acyl-CoA transferase
MHASADGPDFSQKASRAGPLAGIQLVAFASIGPGPLRAMLLFNLGA